MRSRSVVEDKYDVVYEDENIIIFKRKEPKTSFREAVKKFVNMDTGTILAEGMRILTRMREE